MKLYVFFIVVAGCYTYWVRNILKNNKKLLEESRERLVATQMWCRAQSDYWECLDANPLESESHPRAQELLRIYVGAYMTFLDAHPELDGRRHLDCMVERIETWSL